MVSFHYAFDFNFHTMIVFLQGTQISKHPKTFAELFSQSELVKAGDLTQSYVVGRIVQKVKDDLYIDYGGKFYCVCKDKDPEKEDQQV